MCSKSLFRTFAGPGKEQQSTVISVLNKNNLYKIVNPPVGTMLVWSIKSLVFLNAPVWWVWSYSSVISGHGTKWKWAVTLQLLYHCWIRSGKWIDLKQCGGRCWGKNVTTGIILSIHFVLWTFVNYVWHVLFVTFIIKNIQVSDAWVNMSWDRVVLSTFAGPFGQKSHNTCNFGICVNFILLLWTIQWIHRIRCGLTFIVILYQLGWHDTEEDFNLFHNISSVLGQSGSRCK